MSKATRRRPGSSAWLAIGLVILVPALAEAQLLPNRTIRRERPSPAVEAPFNAQVRRDYFGYYPTCWSRFPHGWACPCPNPELPNAAKSFQDIKFNQKRASLDDEAMPGPDDETPAMPDDRAPAMPGENPVPLPNQGRSPFDIETNPRPPAGQPTPPDPLTPDPTAPRPAPGTNRPAPPPGNRTVPPTGLMEMPSLPETAPTTSVQPIQFPGSMEMAPEATLTSNTPTSRPDLGPLPSAPTPASSNPAILPNGAEAEPISAMPAPAQAPKRRSLLGSLFGRGNTRNR
jgi:hypothetical protein